MVKMKWLVLVVVVLTLGLMYNESFQKGIVKRSITNMPMRGQLSEVALDEDGRCSSVVINGNAYLPYIVTGRSLFSVRVEYVEIQLGKSLSEARIAPKDGRVKYYSVPIQTEIKEVIIKGEKKKVAYIDFADS